jgi:hypothetical protein
VIWFVVGLNGAWMAVALALLLQRYLDRRRLRQFVEDLRHGPHDSRQIVLEVARRCFLLPFRRNPVFCPRIFDALGATPTAIIRFGGCCSDRSRLLILALAELGIRAYQITLYHRSGQAQHCLVEAQLDGQPLIVDPSYGISYTTAAEGPVGLRDLQRGQTPVYVPLVTDRVCGYPQNAYYDFDFRLSKTANWTKTRVRRIVYRVLYRVTGGSVDQMEVPALLEWPQHLFIALASTGATMLNTAAMLLTLE